MENVKLSCDLNKVNLERLKYGQRPLGIDEVNQGAWEDLLISEDDTDLDTTETSGTYFPDRKPEVVTVSAIDVYVAGSQD